MLDRKKCTLVMEKVTELLEQHVREKTEAGSPVGRHGYNFEVYGTENIGMMQLVPGSRIGETALQLGVFRKGTDRLWSHFLFSGQPRQMLEKLQDKGMIPEWLKDLESLSGSADEYW